MKSSYYITSYFYNPNIAPEDEYLKRLEDIQRFSGMKNIDLYVGEYDEKKWADAIYQYRSYGEKSIRCWKCYEFRLDEAFRYARENNISMVATTLSISPHKDAAKINSLGKDLAEMNGVEYMEADFKKKDGFKKASELSREYGFYKQNYCGCIYSKEEREENLTNYKKKNSNS